MLRDGVSQDQAKASLGAQATRAERLAMADDIVRNTGPVDELQGQVARLHQRYLGLAAAGA